MSRNLARFSIVLLFLASFSLTHSPSCASSVSDAGENGLLYRDCLSVPTSEFVSSLKTTVDVLSRFSSVLAKFSRLFGDFRLGHAVSDCLDLVDFSLDELSWSISASQISGGKDNGTGDLSSDLRTWLSAALSNADTCVEGFEGTGNGVVEKVVSGGINHVYQLLRTQLTRVHPQSTKRKQRGGGSPAAPSGSGFPTWVKPEDRKLLESNGSAVSAADAVVAQDGTGNFTKFQDAVEAAPDYGTRRFVIYVKKGVYAENVDIPKKKWNIMMVGDGIDVTVITGNRSFGDGWTTFRSATFGVKGRNFIARDLTFQNTAGPQKHQAVALRSDSDLSVIYRCAVRGYQDTLYAHSMRQFYRDCIITGTVDFIFGDGTVVFQNCQILARQGLPNQKNTITAQGRKDVNEPTGFCIQFCNISADADLAPNLNTTPTYLGRPWKQYSRTVFMQSYLSSAVRPEGWLEWNGDFALNTLYYGEYMNRGPGAALEKRVKWAGYHVLNSSAEANNFTVSQFIEGDLWLPATGVKYSAGLTL